MSTILVEIEPGNPNWKTQERLVRFSIEKIFKGSAGKEVELITGLDKGWQRWKLSSERAYTWAIYSHSRFTKIYTTLSILHNPGD